MVIYIFQCYSFKSSHPHLLPQSPKVCSLSLCLFCCLAYRVIIVIFLNSTCMLQCPVLVFFFLTYFTLYAVLCYAKSLQSCLTLCDPIDGSPPGSPVPGILQARILVWVPFPSPGNLPNPGIEPGSPTLQADALPSEPPGKL